MAKGSTKAGGCGCAADQAAELQRRTLWVVLVAWSGRRILREAR